MMYVVVRVHAKRVSSLNSKSVLAYLIEWRQCEIKEERKSFTAWEPVEHLQALGIEHIIQLIQQMALQTQDNEDEKGHGKIEKDEPQGRQKKKILTVPLKYHETEELERLLSECKVDFKSCKQIFKTKKKINKTKRAQKNNNKSETKLKNKNKNIINNESDENPFLHLCEQSIEHHFRSYITKDSSLLSFSSHNIHLTSVTPVTGGFTNLGFRLDISIDGDDGTGNSSNLKRSYFLKANQGAHAQDMFQKEQRGLFILSEYSKNIKVPEVIQDTSLVPRDDGVGDDGNEKMNNNNGHCLILKYINFTNNITEEVQQRFGRELALFHRDSSSLLQDNYGRKARFGLDYDNYRGNHTQINTWCESWIEFFSLHRWKDVIIRLEEKCSSLSNSSPSTSSNLYVIVIAAKKVLSVMSVFFEGLDPDVDLKPTLIHGDLKSSNWGVDSNSGDIVWFDAIPYFAHDEIELSVMPLWGSPSSSFFEEYYKILPKRRGFEVRQMLYQTYDNMHCLLSTLQMRFQKRALERMSYLIDYATSVMSLSLSLPSSGPILRIVNPFEVLIPTNKLSCQRSTKPAAISTTTTTTTTTATTTTLTPTTATMTSAIVTIPQSEHLSACVLVLCGSFCPIHLNHVRALEIARQHIIRHSLFDVVLGGFLSPTPDHILCRKFGTKDRIIPAYHRVMMCEAACRDNDWISVSKTLTMGAKMLKSIQSVAESFVLSSGHLISSVTPVLVCGGDTLAVTNRLLPPPFMIMCVERCGYVSSVDKTTNDESSQNNNVDNDQSGQVKSLQRIIRVDHEGEKEISSTKIRKGILDTNINKDNNHNDNNNHNNSDKDSPTQEESVREMLHPGVWNWIEEHNLKVFLSQQKVIT